MPSRRNAGGSQAARVFSKEDKGLLRDWMAVAEACAAAACKAKASPARSTIR